MVLPHPIMGFCLPDDERKAREIIQNIGTRDKIARVLQRTSPTGEAHDMATAA